MLRNGNVFKDLKRFARFKSSHQLANVHPDLEKSHKYRSRLSCVAVEELEESWKFCVKNWNTEVTSKMSQRLKEVDEESLGTVFYNFCMNHNSVHKVPDLRGIFSATCMLLFLRENTQHQSTFALPYTNYLGFISQHKISCKILQHKLKTLTWVETWNFFLSEK